MKGELSFPKTAADYVNHGKLKQSGHPYKLKQYLLNKNGLKSLRKDFQSLQSESFAFNEATFKYKIARSATS